MKCYKSGGPDSVLAGVPSLRRSGAADFCKRAQKNPRGLSSDLVGWGLFGFSNLMVRRIENRLPLLHDQ